MLKEEVHEILSVIEIDVIETVELLHGIFILRSVAVVGNVG